MDQQRLKFVIEGIAIAAAVIAIVLFASPSAWSPRGNGNPIAANQDPNAAAQINFPSDVPIMAANGAPQSIATPLPNGQVQIKNSFLSTSTTSATFVFYKQFFSATGTGSGAGMGMGTDAAGARGWTFLAQINNPSDPSHRSVLARNASGMLTVNITAQSPSTALVEMTFVSNPGTGN